MTTTSNRAIAEDVRASEVNDNEREYWHKDCQPGECSQAPKRRADA